MSECVDVADECVEAESGEAEALAFGIESGWVAFRAGVDDVLGLVS